MKKEEEDRRAKEEADKKAREEAEAKRKKEEAERIEAENKKALERMKGTTTGDLGIKTKTTANNELKGDATTKFGLKTLPAPDSKYDNLPPKYRNYLLEADKIIVPPPTWDKLIAMEANQIRIGLATDKNKYFMVMANAVVAAFDLSVSSPATVSGAVELAGFKLLLIGLKSTIAAQDEAEVFLFSQNAIYEKMLLYLKDEKKGPQLLAAIKSIREKKPMPAGISPDMASLAAATQMPATGASSVHLVMNAMLSKEAKASFFETAKLEGIELLNSGIRGALGTIVQNRSAALRDANEKINIGQEFLVTEQEPLTRSIIRTKLEEIEHKMLPFEQLPEGILSFIASHEEYNKLQNKK